MKGALAGRRTCLRLGGALLGTVCVPVFAGSDTVELTGDIVYQAPDRFVHEVFKHLPKPSVIWLTPELQVQVQLVLGHPYRQARLRYWRVDDTFAWILDEIGKEYPITAGFVVRAGTLELARVLIYRESRGGEIQMPSFLKQFDGAKLDQHGQLSRRVDGITGATLSVDAMQRMAKLALLLTVRAQA